MQDKKFNGDIFLFFSVLNDYKLQIWLFWRRLSESLTGGTKMRNQRLFRSFRIYMPMLVSCSSIPSLLLISLLML